MANPIAAASLRRMQGAAPGMTPMTMVPSPAMATDTAPVAAPGVTSDSKDPTVAGQISATPAINVNDYLSKMSASSAPAHPVMDAIARALSGFSHGVAATPSGAAYSKGIGGVVGGLSGTGSALAEQRNLEYQRDQPRRDLTMEALKTQIKQQIEDPYKQADIERTKASQIAVNNRKLEGAKDLFKTEAGVRAKEAGISAADYEKLQKDGHNAALMQGVLPGDPGYESLVDSHVNGALQRMKAAGVRGTGKLSQPAPTVPGMSGPSKTAADFLAR